MDSSDDEGRHFVIVALETFYVPVPNFNFPRGYTYEIKEYSRTRPEEVAERIKNANIVLAVVVPITAAALSVEASPHLKMISVVASGTDNVDLDACRARGIVVANAPRCNTVSVAEHIMALYFATRRSMVLSHTQVQAGEWPKKGSLQETLNGPDGKPPKTCRQEKLGIIGNGAVGKAVAEMAHALGMRTRNAARKGTYEIKDRRTGRTPFEDVIQECSVIVLCLPRTPETLNLISEAELNMMQPYTIIINASRGGIVDEKAVIAALREKKIAGYGTDVYETEPASSENSLLVGPDTAGLNLVTTPHVAWVAEDTNTHYNWATMENVEGWLKTGQPKHPVI